MKDITYVGLDVHKTAVCVAITASDGGGGVREVGVFEKRPDILRKPADQPTRSERAQQENRSHWFFRKLQCSCKFSRAKVGSYIGVIIKRLLRIFENPRARVSKANNG